MEAAQLTAQCGKCTHPIEVLQRWTPGGINDYGGYVLACENCGHIFHLRLGRDINDSKVMHGAKVLETYDDEVEDKAAVLARFGLTE